MFPPAIEERERDPEPSSAPLFAVGDWVYVVFWRPFPMLGDTSNGSWDTAPGRVIAAGTLICFAIDNPTLPGWFYGDTGGGSPIRFAALDRVFHTPESAADAIKSLPRTGM